MKVVLIARTIADTAAMENETDGSWIAEGDHLGSASDLSEFAGRECYQSWSRPNPQTARNVDYLGHILEVRHLSVLEHGMVSFRVSGASRSFTHELVRHRHLSYSQVSQRYVNLVAQQNTNKIADVVIPPLFEGDQLVEEMLLSAMARAAHDYHWLLDRAEEILKARGVTGTALTKQAREAARAVLPNMTPTSLVVSGNHRAWREVIDRRIDPAADAEMQLFARQVLAILKRIEPNIYQDMAVEQ